MNYQIALVAQPGACRPQQLGRLCHASRAAPQVRNQMRFGLGRKRSNAENRLRQSLMLVECSSSGIQRAQRGNARNPDVQLRTKKSQQPLGQSIGAVQRATSHAQVANMQHQSQLQCCATTRSYGGDLGCRQREELLGLEFAQPPWDAVNA